MPRNMHPHAASVCACVRACVRVCVRASEQSCVRACVRLCACVRPVVPVCICVCACLAVCVAVAVSAPVSVSCRARACLFLSRRKSRRYPKPMQVSPTGTVCVRTIFETSGRAPESCSGSGRSRNLVQASREQSGSSVTTPTPRLPYTHTHTPATHAHPIPHTPTPSPRKRTHSPHAQKDANACIQPQQAHIPLGCLRAVHTPAPSSDPTPTRAAPVRRRWHPSQAGDASSPPDSDRPDGAPILQPAPPPSAREIIDLDAVRLRLARVGRVG